MPTTQAYARITRVKKSVSLKDWVECINHGNTNPFLQHGESILLQAGEYGVIHRMCTADNNGGHFYTYHSDKKTRKQVGYMAPLGVGSTPIETVLERLVQQGYITYEVL